MGRSGDRQEMENQRYMEERLNLRRLLLWMGRRLWLLAAAAAAGGVLGGGCYLLLHLVILPEREYEAVGKYYLSFQADPEDYNQLSYNGYTWNDLLDTDPIMDEMMKHLPGEISREQAAAATKAEILSDIRLLTVTVTEQSPEAVDLIMEAVGRALIHLGESDPLFERIEIYSQGKAAQILWDNRTVRAVITGVVLAVAAGFLFLCFACVWEDSVYLPEEAEQRYGLPVIGLLLRPAAESGKGTARRRKCRLEQEMQSALAANYGYRCGNLSSLILLSTEGSETAASVCSRIQQVLSQAGEEVGPHLQSGEIPACGADYGKLRKAEGILLAMKAGGKNGCRTGWLLSQLERQDCRVCGLILTEADPVFLKQYYGRSLGRGSGREKD